MGEFAITESSPRSPGEMPKGEVVASIIYKRTQKDAEGQSFTIPPIPYSSVQHITFTQLKQMLFVLVECPIDKRISWKHKNEDVLSAAQSTERTKRLNMYHQRASKFLSATLGQCLILILMRWGLGYDGHGWGKRKKKS